MSVASEKNIRKPPAEDGHDKDLSDGSGSGDSATEMRPADLNAASHRQSIQDRIVALKKLQLEILKLDSQFQQEICDLEKKYHKALQPLYNKRAEIINGVVDPLKEKTKYPNADLEYDEDNAEDFTEMLKGSKAIPADAKGIPNFWLTVLKNTKLSSMIEKHDEPVLKKLRDVKIVNEKKCFIIEFCFGENNYFTNTKLTKEYTLRNDIYLFEFPVKYLGSKIIGCKGCDIDWKPEMNSIVKTGSFFNFFDLSIHDESCAIPMFFAADFEIGHYLRSSIIPMAVSYYTGEHIDGNDDEDEDDEVYDCEEFEEDWDSPEETDWETVSDESDEDDEGGA